MHAKGDHKEKSWLLGDISVGLKVWGWVPAAPQVSKEMSGKPLAGEVWALQQGNGPMISFTLIFDGISKALRTTLLGTREH